MRSIVPNGHKERFVPAGQAVEAIDRNGCLRTIKVAVIRDVDFFCSNMFQIPLPKTVYEAFLITFGAYPRFTLLKPIDVGLQAIHCIRIKGIALDIKLGLTPGRRVLDVVMEDLPDSNRVIPMSHELLSQRHCIRHSLPKVGTQIPNLDRIRT